jgi:hypothetical protein
LRLRLDEVRDWLRPTEAPTVSRPLSIYVPQAPEEIARGLALTRDVLARLRDEAAADGARVGLVLVPARFQLNDEDYGHLSETVAAAGQQLLRDKATERFADALRPLGVPMLDLLPVLRAQPSPAGLFFGQNVHFTVRGHEVVAEALDRFVRESGLLSDRTEPRREPGQPAAPAVGGPAGQFLRGPAGDGGGSSPRPQGGPRVPIADSR